MVDDLLTEVSYNQGRISAELRGQAADIRSLKADISNRMLTLERDIGRLRDEYYADRFAAAEERKKILEGNQEILMKIRVGGVLWKIGWPIVRYIWLATLAAGGYVLMHWNKIRTIFGDR